jgi:hypothetical protein
MPLLAAAVMLGLLSRAAGSAQMPKAHLAGSERCKGCHEKEYDGWKQARMTNVVRDPRQHPEAALGDFTHADPLRTFDLDQVQGLSMAKLRGSTLD